MIWCAMYGCNRGEQPEPPAADDREGAMTPTDAWFVNITGGDLGIDFAIDRSAAGDYFMPDSMTGGCALLDYDNDGDLDLYIVNAFRDIDGAMENPKGANRLYQQQDDHTFRDVTGQAGVGDERYGMGVAVGDIDNDGDDDLYVTNYGRDTLYRNNADGTFTDITNEAGLSNANWSASAGFADLDNDGWLDLFVTNYLNYDPRKRGGDASGRPEYASPSMFDGLPDVLYRNNGDGTFTNTGQGLNTPIALKPGKGLGVIFTDLDGDDIIDIYVVNDGEPNFAWINDGNWGFVDRAWRLGLAANNFGRPEAGMGVVTGDYNGDMLIDVFVTHLVQETNTLYRRLGSGVFEDATVRSGLAASSIDFTGFGVALVDIELDGDLDILIANGRVLRRGRSFESDLQGHWAPYAEPNQLFVNDGGGRFEQVDNTGGAFADDVDVTRGLAVGDLDDDGDIDIVTATGNGTVNIYRNDAPRTGRWLSIEAYNPVRRRCDIGARVQVRIGDSRFIREVSRAGSYLSSGDVRAHFGLGDVEHFDAIIIQWSDGSAERFEGGSVDRSIRLEKGSGTELATES